MLAFINRTLVFACIFALGAVSVLARDAIFPQEKTPEEWVEMARYSELDPCFSDLILLGLYNQSYAEHRDLSLDEKIARFGADRLITGGHHKGTVVPENCFAVAYGLFGFNITFWQRPRNNGGFDMSIPYWNPDPDQLSVDG